MDDIALTLDPAAGEDDFGGTYRSAATFIDARTDDEIELAGFIFECDKDHPAGGAGTLTDGDDARHHNGRMMRVAQSVFDPTCTGDRRAIQTIAQKVHGMLFKREAEAGIIIGHVRQFVNGR